MKSLSFFVVILIIFKAQAQEEECSSFFDPADTIHMAHFGNNEILSEILATTMPNRSNNARSNVGELESNFRFRIPVKVWVYSDDNGSNSALAGGHTEILAFLDQVNTEFANNNTGIQFYLKCAPEGINSTKYNDLSDSEFDDIVVEYRDRQALNWHFVRNFVSAGRANFPEESRRFSLVINTIGSYFDLTGLTLVHEIGHTLGLLHTHENARSGNNWNGSADNCFQESVDRDRRQWGCVFSSGKKCDKNGDALCDTQAAPNREGGGRENMSLDNPVDCNYTGGGSDNWGDPWLDGPPPTRNYMSYLQFRACRSEFTPQQIAVMHSKIVAYMATCVTNCHTTPPGYISSSIPWYNRDGIVLTGDVNNGDAEGYHLPGTIQLSKSTSEDHSMHAGGSVELTTPDKVVLKPGFKAYSGSHLSVNVVSNIYFMDCSEMYAGSRVSGGTFEYDIDVEMINEVREILTRPRSVSEVFIENPDEPEVSIYPNPVENNLSIVTNSSGEKMEFIELFNLNGKRVLELQITSDGLQNKIYRIDLSKLPKGIYNYVLHGDKATYTGKVIKE